ncbi:MAG: excinuclease ABC subunit UvrA, partial [Thermodesulfobacteriota bacterium]|nr:excinuclease ABC subunit UvrA [Thermodesulfobacteriota bacterium]
MKYIKIRGARQHNLKDVNIDIPRDKLVTITGVSGSGKSSLAFDTIYAEGQRRYVESLSTYARQFIGQMDKPEVESIEGLSPAIAIEQRSASRNPRSTVGTVTEIYDYLRLLFARVGIPHCYNCGKRIDAQTVEMMAEKVQSLPEDTKINIMSPIVRGRKGEFQKEFKRLCKEGFARVRVDGSIRDLAEDIAPDKNRRHNIDVVIDRLIIKTGIGKRLRDSLEIATRLSGGLVGIQIVDGEELLFSENYACPECGISMPELTPRMFSFNSPYGACPECGGLGTKVYFDENLIVPDPGLSIREGAIAPWEQKDSIYFHQMLEALSSHYKFDINTPFNKLPEKVTHVLLHGSGDEKIGFYFDKRERRHFYEKRFKGVLYKLEQRYREEKTGDSRMELSRYMNISDCPVCGGARLKKESLSVTVGEKNIDEISRMSIRECMGFFDNMSFSYSEAIISKRIRKEIMERLQFILEVGMDYLSLSRSSGTLSGGEAQRIRLATQIGSGLVGVLYVLDEPTIGLHPRDNMRLVSTLKRLRDMGNTVLVVEHDAQIMNCSDDIVDVGPGAGMSGGNIVFHGSPEEIRKSDISLTGKYLSGRLTIPVPENRRPLSG